MASHCQGRRLRDPERQPVELAHARSTVDTMANEVISYIEMCRREGTSLQQGMNFGIGGNHSVILTSVRGNAPYRDRREDGGTTACLPGARSAQRAKAI